MGQPLLSIIIVAYQSRDEIGACLGSIPRELARADGTRGAVEVCVVDNSAAASAAARGAGETERGGKGERGRGGEGDDVGERVRRDFPWVDYVAAETNLGFGRANNLGFAKTRGAFVLFLNPDTVCTAAALEHCVARLEADRAIGLISPKLVTADGTMDLACRRSIPTLWDGFCRASGLAGKWPGCAWVAGYNLTFLPEAETYDVGDQRGVHDGGAVVVCGGGGGGRGGVRRTFFYVWG